MLPEQQCLDTIIWLPNLQEIISINWIWIHENFRSMWSMVFNFICKMEGSIIYEHVGIFEKEQNHICVFHKKLNLGCDYVSWFIYKKISPNMKI